MSDPFYDHQPGPERREKLNELYAIWAEAIGTTNTWFPLLESEQYNNKQLLKIYDWVGGVGDKPTETGYLSEGGLTQNKDEASDFRGEKGEAGDLATPLTGLEKTDPSEISESSTILDAIGNLQAQLLQMPMAGPAPNQVAVNQMLGKMAFADAIGATSATRHVRDSKPGDVWHEYVSDTQLIKKFHGDDNVIRSITETYA